MSKSKNPIKVLKTAYNRLEKGWEKGDWHYRDSDGNNYVCIEGALYGFCTEPKTEAQRIAGKTVEQIIMEMHEAGEIKLKVEPRYYERIKSEKDLNPGKTGLIPHFNDRIAETVDEILRVVKLAIIRLETGGPIEDNEFIEFDPDEDLVDLLPKK